MTRYEDSGFTHLFMTKKTSEAYEAGCEDYVTPKRLAKGLEEQIINLKRPSPKVVVAYAVGTGFEAEQIKKKFTHINVIGIDLSKEMLKIAQEKNRIDISTVGNITKRNPEVKDNTADIVICCGGTEFNPGKLKNIADEMVRTARSNAIIAITVRPPGQEAARPGYAYYTTQQVKDAFNGAIFLEEDQHISFAMSQKLSQSTEQKKEEGKEKINVIYNTIYFQAPAA